MPFDEWIYIQKGQKANILKYSMTRNFPGDNTTKNARHLQGYADDLEVHNASRRLHLRHIPDTLTEQSMAYW